MNGERIRNAGAETSVVFVHGILARQKRSWRHPNGTYWPELLAQEKDFQHLNIYVFSYRTGIFSGSYQLGDVIDALKERMRLDRVQESKRIIFVCHSMGGIVVRRYLVVRQMDFSKNQTHIGLFLIASPSLGSSYANLLTALGRALGISNMQATTLRFTQDNTWLNDLNKDFIDLKESGRLAIRGKELVEDHFIFAKNWWKKQVVEPFSGRRYFGDSYKVEGSDHFSIATPENSTAIQHQLLCHFIRELLPEPIIVTRRSESRLDPAYRIGKADDDPLESRYRKALIESFRWLPLPDAFGAKIDLGKLDLARLFVRLRLVPDLPSHMPDLPEELRDSLTQAQLALLPDLAAHRASMEELGPISTTLMTLLKGWLDEVLNPALVDVGGILNTSQHVAIIGSGGTGKTTLTRWLTLICAQDSHANPAFLGPRFAGRLVPIRVDLRGFAKWRALEQVSMTDITPEQMLVRYVTRPEALGLGKDAEWMLLDLLRRGEVIVLFDGLDELFDRDHRAAAIQIIRNFAISDSGRTSRAVVTSRPYACPAGTLGSSFLYANIAPFDVPQFSSYLADHWYPTVYGPRFAKEARSLIVQIKAEPHLLELAVNPLLCTLLAILYRRGQRPLPLRRTEVYEQCTALLLHIWDDEKGVEWPQQCSQETKLALVAALAYEALMRAPFLTIPKRVARDRAAAFLQDKLACPPDTATRSADSLLRTIEARSGLMESHDTSNLHFLLRPFLDYLAARHLADLKDGLHREKVIISHLFDGEWGIVVSLMFARLASAKGEGRESLIPLLRAMVGAMPWPPPLPPGILVRSRKWRDEWVESKLLRVQGMIAEALKEIGSEVAEAHYSDILSVLQQRLAAAFSHGLMEQRERAAHALGDIAAFSKSSRLLLQTALQNKSEHMRHVAALALSRKARGNAIAREDLFKATLSDVPEVSATATRALLQIGADNLFEVDVNIERKLKQRLLSFGHAPRESIKELVSSVTHADEALDDIAWFGKQKRVSGLGTDVLHDYLYWLAARAVRIPTLAEVFVKALSDREQEVRFYAALELRSWEHVSGSGVVAALKKALYDKDGSIGEVAAQALAKRAPFEPNAKTALIEAFRDQESKIRLRVLPALGDMAETMPEVVGVLLGGLEDESIDVRLQVAKREKAQAKCAEKCLSVLRQELKDPSSAIRREAVESIARFCLHNPSVIEDMRSAVNDPDGNVRLAAMRSVSRFAATAEEEPS